jgi:hypothetical protein
VEALWGDLEAFPAASLVAVTDCQSHAVAASSSGAAAFSLDAKPADSSVAASEKENRGSGSVLAAGAAA